MFAGSEIMLELLERCCRNEFLELHSPVDYMPDQLYWCPQLQTSTCKVQATPTVYHMWEVSISKNDNLIFKLLLSECQISLLSPTYQNPESYKLPENFNNICQENWEFICFDLVMPFSNIWEKKTENGKALYTIIVIIALFIWQRHVNYSYILKKMIDEINYGNLI